MYKWDELTKVASLRCDFVCGAIVLVNQRDFSKKQWESLDPENALWESAQQLGWDLVWDDDTNCVVQACKTCVFKKKVGL